jgi:hypothetical protein
MPQLAASLHRASWLTGYASSLDDNKAYNSGFVHRDASQIIHFSRKLPKIAEKSRQEPKGAEGPRVQEAKVVADSRGEASVGLRLGGYLVILLTGSGKI